MNGVTLCTFSCDINLRDHKGLTPLHTAVLCNSPETTKVLVQKGASVTIKDNHDKTALQYCMELVSAYQFIERQVL